MNRRFREVRDRAQLGTVTITHHGKPSLVVLAIDHYRALAASGSADVLRRKLWLMLDNLNEGYVSLDANFVIDGVNRSAESFVGSTRGDLIGQPFTSVFPDGPETLAQARHSIAGGEIIMRERASQRFPNRRLSVTTFPLPKPDGGVAILFANLTELERSRTACAESDATVASLLDTLDATIVIVTRADVIERWGRGAERLLGWSESEAVGRSLARMLSGSGEREADLLHFAAKDGTVVAARGVTTPIGIVSDLATLVYHPVAT